MAELFNLAPPRVLANSRGWIAVALGALLLAALSCQGSGLPQRDGGVSEICDNGQDDDLDQKTDCVDPDCFSAVLCQGPAEECGNGQDDDADGTLDCADEDCRYFLACLPAPDGGGLDGGTALCDGGPCEGSCPTGSQENCTDGQDNNCDRAVDCADSQCANQLACTQLDDGKPCRLNNQCAGGLCRTEAQDGAPNGSCRNSSACTVGSNAGCHGGRCLAFSGGATTCLPPCIGTGRPPYAALCRQGYVCVDIDGSSSNLDGVCLPHCTSDSQCGEQGPGFGCNPYSGLCELKDKGGKKYGEACLNDFQCESYTCLDEASTHYPGGYCSGPCSMSGGLCGSGGVCLEVGVSTDDVGNCYDRCGPGDLCRANYLCVGNATGDYCDTFL